MSRNLFDKKPQVREDEELDPDQYGHSDYIPEHVKKP